jgi:HD-GYP domain-containing protein (c-di-GMP phosphodiesterase class II)
MRRRVLFDAKSPTARAVASLLEGGFEVDELQVPLADRAVFLVDAGTPLDDVPEDGVRVIGLVPPGPRLAWPARWWAALPVGAGTAVIAQLVDNAFADLEAAAEIRRLGAELADLHAIGARLSSERNPDALLELILTKAREITESDAGSLYLVEDAEGGTRHLRFALAQNDSLDVPYRTATLPLTSDSVAGHVALTGEVVNLDDAYAPPAGAPFHINRAFDELTGYRSTSMLVVPMRTPKGETIGALQLINRAPGGRGRLGSPADAARLVQPFTAQSETLATSLASQAAVALENNRLYESIRRLFEGFVKAAVTAIESRDPTTSGHSFRVAELTTGLAEVVDACPTGPYAAMRFTPDQLMELRYAALLHDFGKVGVREEVLLKAKKLYPAELERIQARVALIKRGLDLRYTRLKLDYLVARGRRGYERHASRLDAELAALCQELDDSLARVVRANEPSVLPEDMALDIERIASRVFEDHQGTRHTVITPEEAAVLAIPRGSLTPEEYGQIQSHVVHTYQFLAQIPWTKEFQRIPEIARSHHEKLDGSGYPYGKRDDEIPVQSKMMTIADIFDALTASDRPYKQAIGIEAALDILHAERRRGAIDAHLLEVFIAARVYDRTR